jgi:ligand-binding SRPBCC domain-containing protein
MRCRLPPGLAAETMRSHGRRRRKRGFEWVERSSSPSAKVVDNQFTHAIRTWVSVPPVIAFDYLADITRHAEWAHRPLTAEPLDPRPVHVGSRFRAVGRQGGRNWPSDLVVTDCDRPRRFAFTATGGPIPATEDHLHRHEFMFSEERGGTRLLVRRTNPIPGRAIRLLLPLITRYALRVRFRTIEKLRQRLEGS